MSSIVSRSWTYLLLILLVVTLCYAEAPESVESELVDIHHQKQHQKHKDLFPLSNRDIIGLALSSIGLMIAAGGGIGGGGILVPLFILILGFSPKHAIPLSNLTILGGGITNSILNMSKRHPQADRPLVDWDLILVMEPLTIAGALAGSFMNKLLPEWLLVVCLILLLAVTSKRTLEKGFKQYAKETEQRKIRLKESELTVLHSSAKSELEEEESSELLKDAERNEIQFDAEELAKKAELNKILEEEKETPYWKIGSLIGVFIIVLALNLLKGGGAFESPLGIECGTTAFWAITFANFAWLIIVSYFVRQYLVKRYYLKAKVGFKYIPGDVRWDESATIKYPAYCFFAGFAAGMFGVGGGIVKGPLMIEMGVHPLVASATAACMILYTSFTAATSFLVFGLITYDYGVLLSIMGVIATGIGQLIINYLIEKSKRHSYVTLSIGGVVALSTLLMGLQSIIAMMKNEGSSGGSICEVGE